MDSVTIRHLSRIVTDILILSILLISILLFFLYGEPYKRGFYCNDPNIRYPFKESTISDFMLCFVGLGLPTVSIIIVELINWYNYRTIANGNFVIYNKTIPGWIVSCYKYVGYFYFGAALCQMITDLAKYSIGRLRPHFFEICMPDVDCSRLENQFKYFDDFKCLSSQKSLIKEARLSFPSGHASVAAYTMLYLIIYFQYRFQFRKITISRLLKPLLQFICACLAWITGLSRVSDYKHHWSDVLSGFVIGTIFAILMSQYIFDYFKESRNKLLPLNSTCNNSNIYEATEESLMRKSETTIEL